MRERERERERERASESERERERDLTGMRVDQGETGLMLKNIYVFQELIPRTKSAIQNFLVGS